MRISPASLLHAASREGYVLIGLFVSLAFTGCGGSLAAFGPSYPDSKESAIAGLLEGITEAPKRSIIAAYSSREGRLFVYDAEARRLLFDRALMLEQAPFIAGAFIVVASRGQILGLDLSSGEERFSFGSNGEMIVGADGDGERVAITLSERSATNRSRLIAYEGSAKRFERPAQHALGSPLVRGALIVVPWANQNLSFLEFPRGEEIARMRAIGAVLGHAETFRGKLISGQQQLFLMDAKLAERPHLIRTEGVGWMARELPGRPLIRKDPYAEEKNHQAIALDASLFLEKGALKASLYYYGFQNILAGLEPTHETLDWLIRLDAKIAGLRASEEGALVVTTAGRIHRVDIRGTFSTLYQFPVEIDGVAIQTGDLAALEGDNEEGARALTPLELFQERNAQLVPISLLAIHSMRDDSAPQHTGDLVLIAGDPAIAPRLRAAAREALTHRKSLDSRFIELLKTRENFLEGSTSPPSGPMALAVAAAGRGDLLPLLLEHLRDPTTPGAELADLLQGIGLLAEQLGDASAARAIRDFVTLYHANAEESSRVDALIEAAAAYKRLTGEEGAAYLRAISEAPFTVFPLRRAIRSQRFERSEVR